MKSFISSTFIFIDYTLNKEKGEVIFSYKLKTPTKVYNFNETLLFPSENIVWDKIPENIVKKSLNNLLLMLGISYWKLLCPSKILLETIKLSHEQAIFWETVFTKGLGEFFYKNEIDFVNLVHFPFDENVIKNESEAPFTNLQDGSLNDRSLLFFGGGKDSIVAAELLKKAKKDFATIVVNPTEIHKQTLNILGKDGIFIKRIIDPQLFELNKQNGFYNGHVPATAINDFIGVFASIIYDYKFIISSNEKSASYGNVNYLGQEINHQWSKSYEFEKLLSNYVRDFIFDKIVYFSILRPLSEIKIAEIFSTMPEYFSSFSSCNKNFRLKDPLVSSRWCCECPKCLFVFMLLAAFLPREKIVFIFGKDLFNEKSLLPTFKDLLGLQKVKPFECVGTPEEGLLAMFLTYQKGEYMKEILMDYFEKEVLSIIQNPSDLQNKLLEISKNHSIPKKFQSVINV